MRSRTRRPSISLAVIAVAAAAFVPTLGARATESVPASDPVVVAVGDIACQTLTNGQGTATCQSGAVANLI